MDLLLQKKRVPRELVRVVQGVVLAVALARRGLRKKSLSKSGAAAGALVAAVTWSSGPRFGLTLIAFYQSGSFVTKIGSARKTRQDANATEAGERDAAQVLSCSLVAAVIALAYRVACGDDRPCTDEEGVCGSLIAAFVAFFGCCCGDTFASEIGSLATSEPRLITRPWQKVPPGTNGGVTILGTVASALGGLFIGIVHGIGGFFLEREKNSNNIFPKELLALAIVGLVAGLVGSLADSILGALFQRTLYDPERKCIAKDATSDQRLRDVTNGKPWLSNHAVNFLSAAAATALGPPIKRAAMASF